MKRQEKIKLLKNIAAGDSSALYQINKGISVIFIDMIDNEGYWIEYFSFDPNKKDIDIDNLTTEQILNDNSIRKYTTTELKRILKRRFVFAIPMELLYGTQPEIMEFYNKYSAFNNQ